MRMPWSKDKGDDLARDLDRDDDPGYEEVDETNEEVEETLDDVEPDLKARFDRVMARAQEKMAGEQRARESALRELGLDFTSDGTAAIRDMQKVTAWAKDLVPRGEPAPRAEATREEPEEEINFFDMDAAKFNQLVEKRAGKLVDDKLAAFKQQNAWQEAEVRQVGAREALRRAESAVSRHAPHYAPLLQHPDFEAALMDAMLTAQPEALRDERSLVALVGGVGAFLDMEKLPRSRGRDKEGRFAATQASRASLSQIGPSRDSSRAGVPRAPEEEASRRFVSELVGRDLSAQDMAAAQNVSIDEWRKAKAAKR